MTKSNQRKNLDHLIRSKLRQAILDGTLKTGSHLNEVKLSQVYGVSRTPIREALCSLTADGLVKMIPHRGAFVCTPSAETLKQTQTLYGNLIALAGRFATPHLAETDLARLERATADMSHPGQNFEAARQTIHTTLIHAAQMPPLQEMLTQLEGRLVHPRLTPVTLQEEAKSIQQGYHYFYVALKRSKADAAEKAMREVMTLNFNVSAVSNETSGAA